MFVGRMIGAMCWGWVKVLKKYSRAFFIAIISLCIFLTLYTVSIKTDPADTTKDSKILGPAFALLRGSHIDNVNELSDLSSKEQNHLVKNVRTEVERIVLEITQKSENKKQCEAKWNGYTTLTLFTTWVYDKDKFEINNKTLYNWKMLPNVNLVVFSNDKEVKHYSSEAGWHVFPIIQEADNAPILSAMYKEVMAKFNTIFYGYANGDLLFTDNLLDTLQQIMCQLKTKQLLNNMLIVGKRTNVPAEEITYETTLSWTALKSFAESRGTLFQPNALDYFITSGKYPWDKMLPLVVGRRGYDNWVVAYSLYNDMFIIDATETILCVHQTLESRGNWEGLTKGNYNLDLIEGLNLPFSYSKWGENVCAKWRTWYNMAGSLVLDRRTLKPYCTQYFKMYSVWKFLGLEASDSSYNVSKALAK